MHLHIPMGLYFDITTEIIDFYKNALLHPNKLTIYIYTKIKFYISKEMNYTPK